MACRPHDPRERLRKEFSDIQQESLNEMAAHMVGDNLHQWKGYIKGPQSSPYQGGTFVLDIQMPREYPYNPPKIKFDTKIWHPNISSVTGAICLDILKNEWSPALTIRTVLLSIQALLSSPEPDDPQDAEVANMYKLNYAEFIQTATLWTQTFASSSEESHEEKIGKLKEMGFAEEKAKVALLQHNWDETMALNSLLEGA